MSAIFSRPRVSLSYSERISLAVLAQSAGRRTLLVDLDPQRSAAQWWMAREAETPQLAEAEPAKLRDLLDAAREDGVDTVVVDTRPAAATDASYVAACCDLLVIPTRPAILDMRAILATLDVVKGAARRSTIVLNACPPARGAGEASTTVDARHALAGFGVPVCPAAITQRTRFATSLIAVLTAGEVVPSGKGAREMRALWKNVEKELHR